jgi:putative glutamine amidotransferase
MRYVILLVVLSGHVCFTEAQERPVIGLSDIYKNGGCSVPRSYVEAVLFAGGIPVIVPLMYDDDKIVELLKSLDGVIFTGGEDFDPSYYNETPILNMNNINAPRDTFDIKLLHLAVKNGIPVLGICRGVQLINIAYGGSLYQDLSVQYPDKSIKHRQTLPKEEPSHAVNVEDSTVFADIVGERMLMVNSSHHQAIKKLAKGFRIAGTSPDKVIEAIEKVDSTHWIVGVQFHPEVMVNNSPSMRRIFKSFVDKASCLKLEKQQTLYAHITAMSVPKSGASVYAGLCTPTAFDGKNDRENEKTDITTPDNHKTDSLEKKNEMVNKRLSKEHRGDEMKTFKEKERQRYKEQKELEKQVQKEKERQEKEDFKKWVQERRIEDKEQKEKEKAAEKEAAEKEKQRRKELQEKADKEKQSLKEAERQEKTVKKEQAKKEKAAKKEAAEKEKQHRKELQEKADKEKQSLKEAERQEKTVKKEQAKKEEAAKKEAAEKEKQRRKELQEKADKEKQSLKEAERQEKIMKKEQRKKEKTAKKEES